MWHGVLDLVVILENHATTDLIPSRLYTGLADQSFIMLDMYYYYRVTTFISTRQGLLNKLCIHLCFIGVPSRFWTAR